MKTFDKIPVVGTKFRSPQERQALMDLNPFEIKPVQFKPEPENKYDKNAIAVFVGGIHAGYVPAAMCIEFGEFLAANPDLTATSEITVRDGAPVVSVNISTP